MAQLKKVPSRLPILKAETGHKTIEELEQNFFDVVKSIEKSHEIIVEALNDHAAAGFSDYLVDGGTIRTTGANTPDWAEFRNGLFLYGFDGGGANEEEAFFVIHILHDIKEGTIPTFHIHWTHKDADPSGNVKWFVDYSVAKGYGVSTYAAPTTLSTIQAAGDQYTHHITDDDDMPLGSITEIEPDSVLIGRIYRDPTDESDTFGSDAFLVHVDLHYVISAHSTPERNRPFTGF